MDIHRHWSLDGFATDKIKLLQAISDIFLLRDEIPILLLTDLKPEKELQFTLHRHFIFLRHHTSKFVAKIRVSTAKNNIIDINLKHTKRSFLYARVKRVGSVVPGLKPFFRRKSFRVSYQARGACFNPYRAVCNLYTLSAFFRYSKPGGCITYTSSSISPLRNALLTSI